MEKESDVSFYCRKGALSVVLILFVILFAVVFFYNKTAAEESYNQANQASPAIRNYMTSTEEVKSVISKYGIIIGLIFAIISYVLVKVLQFILGIMNLDKLKIVNLLVLLCFSAILLAFGIQLAFLESRFTPIGNGVIFYVGYPLFYSALIMTIVVILSGIFALKNMIKSLFAKETSHRSHHEK